MNSFFIAVLCLHVAAAAWPPSCKRGCVCPEIVPKTVRGKCVSKWTQVCDYGYHKEQKSSTRREWGACKSTTNNPVDGQWGAWTQFSCNKPCGGGLRGKKRTCDNPPPSNGGRSCQGWSSSWSQCNTQPCAAAVDGQWGAWTEFSCTKPCGRGLRGKKRTCDNPPPSNGGSGCSGANAYQYFCNTQPCSEKKPIPSGGVQPGPDGSSNGGGCLANANMYRQKHIGTPDLALDESLTRKAQAYAEKLVDQMIAMNALSLAHDPNNKQDKTGENLYASWEPAKGGLDAFCPKANKKWYAEIKDYSIPQGIGVNGKATGHFTQMVWKSSTKVGYGFAAKQDPTYPKNSWIAVVAKYSPEGNFYYIGRKAEDYKANVRPLRSGDEVVEAMKKDAKESEYEVAEKKDGDDTAPQTANRRLPYPDGKENFANEMDEFMMGGF